MSEFNVIVPAGQHWPGDLSSAGPERGMYAADGYVGIQTKYKL